MKLSSVQIMLQVSESVRTRLSPGLPWGGTPFIPARTEPLQQRSKNKNLCVDDIPLDVLQSFGMEKIGLSSEFRFCKHTRRQDHVLCTQT